MADTKPKPTNSEPLPAVITVARKQTQLTPEELGATRAVDGDWEVWDPVFPTTIERVAARGRHELHAVVVRNDVRLLVTIRACPCCGLPWISQAFLWPPRRNAAHQDHTNLATMFPREARFAVAGTVYGVAVRAKLRGFANLLPVER